MISVEKIKEHKKLYRRFFIPELYDNKIHHIPNASEFDSIDVSEKNFSGVIVLYSGRATYEKRAHLVVAIAREGIRMYEKLEIECINSICLIFRLIHGDIL